MNDLGTYYGATLLDEIDLLETSDQNRIELEYYGTEKHSNNKSKEQTFYGISIVKKEYKQDKIKYEKNTIDKISTNENIVENIIAIMKQHKVTPIGLEDVLRDLLKKPEFQET